MPQNCRAVSVLAPSACTSTLSPCDKTTMAAQHRDILHKLDLQHKFQIFTIISQMSVCPIALAVYSRHSPSIGEKFENHQLPNGPNGCNLSAQVNLDPLSGNVFKHLHSWPLGHVTLVAGDQTRIIPECPQPARTRSNLQKYKKNVIQKGCLNYLCVL